MIELIFVINLTGYSYRYGCRGNIFYRERTHHTIEDIAIASSLPNMQVLPCDPLEMRDATSWCAKISEKLTYMRLGKVGEPILQTK